MILSIITTLYKSEPYIRKCLDSLLDQDFDETDYELVIVDDGSPDNCVKIIQEEYLPNHNNIVLVRRENGGLPEARNTGLDNIHGKYVTFVDPDDYVQPDSYCKLIRHVQENSLDMLRFNYNQIDESTGEIIPKYKESLISVKYEDKVVDGETFLGKYLGYACYVWQFIFKSSLFLETNIRFREKVFDDADVLPRVLLNVNRVSSVDIVVYNYMLRQGSLANAISFEGAKKKLNGFFYIIEQYNSLYTRYNDRYAKKWLDSSVWNAYVGILQLCAVYDYKNVREYIDRFNSVNHLPVSTHNRYIKKKVHISLSHLMPRIYCYIYHCLHK